MAKITEDGGYPQMASRQRPRPHPVESKGINFSKVTWQRVRTLWPKKSEDGTHIPMFSYAYSASYDRSANVHKDEMWMTEEEYTFAKLKGEI